MAIASSEVSAGDVITATERNNLRKDVLLHAGDTPTGGGSADAYTAVVDSQITALATGMVLKFTVAANNTGASTVQVTNGAALNETDNIVRADGSALVGGELKSGQVAVCIFDGADWQLISAYFDFANYDDLTDGSNADSLHTHDFGDVTEVYTESVVDTGLTKVVTCSFRPRAVHAISVNGDSIGQAHITEGGTVSEIGVNLNTPTNIAGIGLDAAATGIITIDTVTSTSFRLNKSASGTRFDQHLIVYGH